MYITFIKSVREESIKIVKKLLRIRSSNAVSAAITITVGPKIIHTDL